MTRTIQELLTQTLLGDERFALAGRFAHVIALESAWDRTLGPCVDCTFLLEPSEADRALWADKELRRTRSAQARYSARAHVSHVYELSPRPCPVTTRHVRFFEGDTLVRARVQERDVWVIPEAQSVAVPA